MVLNWALRRLLAGNRFICLISLVIAAPTSLFAMTLPEALVAAYKTNPTLDGQRAALRSIDEQAAIARGNGRPQASIAGSYTQGLNGLRDLQGYNRAIIAGPSLTVPVYQGGRVRYAIHAADARSEGGRSQLKSVEGDTFLQAATAYLDVVRDQDIVREYQENLESLHAVQQQSEVRMRAGDVTRTDLSQSVARARLGEANLASAAAELVNSQQEFRQVIGTSPMSLSAPPPLPVMPADIDSAAQVAYDNNPAISAAAGAVKAAHYEVSEARSARNPTLAFTGSSTYYNYRDRFAGIGNISSDASAVGVTVSLPIYQGGIAAAQIRDAEDRTDQAIDQNEAIERQVDADTRAAFEDYKTATGNIDTIQAAIKADEDALAGVRVEAKAGERQVLDILNAELELVDSRVELIRAKHDAYIAGFRLLNAMGMADHKHLNLDSNSLYDPMINYRHAIKSVSDFTGRAGGGYGSGFNTSAQH